MICFKTGSGKPPAGLQQLILGRRQVDRIDVSFFVNKGDLRLMAVMLVCYTPKLADKGGDLPKGEKKKTSLSVDIYFFRN